jgi:F-type H+-transporting ATPase subunit b
MINVASAIAEEFVSKELKESEQAKLIDDTLEEMGEDTWRS